MSYFHTFRVLFPCQLNKKNQLVNMPGHVKKGKPGEADPDPSQYLIISLEMKREDMLKPYDPKKSYWCPDGKGSFMESMLESDDETKAVVMCGHEVCARLFHNFTASFISLCCFFRKRFSSLLRLDRSTLPSLRSVRTWLT